jgi:hypothetical protein
MKSFIDLQAKFNKKISENLELHSMLHSARHFFQFCLSKSTYLFVPKLTAAWCFCTRRPICFSEQKSMS